MQKLSVSQSVCECNKLELTIKLRPSEWQETDELLRDIFNQFWHPSQTDLSKIEDLLENFTLMEHRAWCQSGQLGWHTK